MTKQPNVTLTLDHVPQHCRRARTILMGPLTPTDLDAAAFVHQELGMLRPTNTCMHAVNVCTECAGMCRGSIPRPSTYTHNLLQALILFCMLSGTFINMISSKVHVGYEVLPSSMLGWASLLYASSLAVVVSALVQAAICMYVRKLILLFLLLNMHASCDQLPARCASSEAPVFR